MLSRAFSFWRVSPYAPARALSGEALVIRGADWQDFKFKISDFKFRIPNSRSLCGLGPFAAGDAGSDLRFQNLSHLLRGWS